MLLPRTRMQAPACRIAANSWDVALGKPSLLLGLASKRAVAEIVVEFSAAAFGKCPWQFAFGQRRRQLAALAEELRDQAASLDLRVALAADPCPGEAPAHDGDRHRGAAAGGPRSILLVGLVGPLPDALARAQLLREGLLQPVLHPHQRGLPLGHLQRTVLSGIAGPIRWRSWDLFTDGRRRAGVGAESVLVARALQVPQHPARRVVGGCLL
mmetsp:Transcript_81850/g.206636  ORF Transcript_81850/g.206636 Transcript_81850/m.206636 type:complete len:212 (+) Transcript_81850:369-1004(+)